MRLCLKIISAVLICALHIPVTIVKAEENSKPVFGRTDPSRYQEFKNVHGGAGSIYFMELVGSDDLKSNLLWVHRGIIPPKSGIGEHLQRGMEDMFFSFNAPAEFTVNGNTSLLPAGSCVLCPMGSSHGIYNNSNETIEWMNIGVSTVKDKFKVIDFGDSLTNKQLESPAPFKWAQFDRSLLKPSIKPHEGKGTVYYRNLWEDDSFKTPWLRLGHALLPPDTSLGYHQHNALEIIYYIMAGNGRMTLDDHTWDVRPGDAIPCKVFSSHGIYNNTDKNLEIFYVVIGTGEGENTCINFGDDLSDR